MENIAYVYYKVNRYRDTHKVNKGVRPWFSQTTCLRVLCFCVGFFFKHLVTLNLPLFEVHNPRMLGLKRTQRIFSPTHTHQGRKES